MRRLLTPALGASLLLAPLAWGQDPAPAKAQAARKKVDLAVLYVGSKQGPRTEDFVEFLGKHFEEVGTAVYPEFKAEQADPYDVVILDVQMKISKRSIGIGKRPQLPQDYSRATVLVNGPGVMVADRQLKSKIDWL